MVYVPTFTIESWILWDSMNKNDLNDSSLKFVFCLKKKTHHL